MNKITSIAFIVGYILAGTPLLACTAFTASRGDTILAGNNEGKHSYDLPALFPKTFIADSFLNAFKKRKAIVSAEVNPEIFADYIGIYEMPSALGPNTAIAITKRGNKLYGFYPEMPSQELLPISNSQFLNISKSGVVKVTFEKSKPGHVSEIKVELKGQTFTAKKIK